ncbi:hypothetical protein ABG794_14780 [Enterobacter soli]
MQQVAVPILDHAQPGRVAVANKNILQAVTSAQGIAVPEGQSVYPGKAERGAPGKIENMGGALIRQGEDGGAVLIVAPLHGIAMKRERMREAVGPAVPEWTVNAGGCGAVKTSPGKGREAREGAVFNGEQLFAVQERNRVTIGWGIFMRRCVITIRPSAGLVVRLYFDAERRLVGVLIVCVEGDVFGACWIPA